MGDRRTVRAQLGVAVALLALGAALAAGALALGDDRVVPCGSLRGPDAWLDEEVSHVDGPEGGGGCIVPTAGSWATAAVVGLTPLAAAAASSWRNRARSSS